MNYPDISNPRIFRQGMRHITRVDPKIRKLIKTIGPIKFTIDEDPFESLVESIISQQLSWQSATAIFRKLKTSLNRKVIDAQSLSELTDSELRQAGVSPQKILYLRDLTSRVLNGRLELKTLSAKADDEAVRVLDEVKGIGSWTAQMFLLFVLGRPDVLPVDDLGIQLAIKKVYSLRRLPKAEKIEKLAVNWHPYCSIAALYLWHAKRNQIA